jgi:signal transduction histidine kinase
LRRVPIRLKLAAALSIPLLALTAVTVLEVLKSADEVDEIRDQTDLAKAAIGPSGLIASLQNERTWPGIDLVGFGGQVTVPVEGYEETRAETDRALDEFRERVTSEGDAIAAAYEPALAGLVELEQLRADIDANVAAVNPRTLDNNGDFSQQVFERYTTLIEPFFDATTRIALAIDDPELRQGTEMADASTRQIEVLSLLASKVIRDATTTEGGVDTPQEIAGVSMLHTSFVRNAAAMQAGTGPYAQIAADSFPVALTDDINEQVDNAITTGTVDITVMLAALDVPKDQSYAAYQEAVAAEIVDRGGVLNDAAQARQRWFAALGLLVVGAALLLTWWVSRSITKPLRSLTRQAKDMAERRLPDAVIDILETPLGDDIAIPMVEPVRLTTRDEVSDVSAALNTVQDTALDLAVEQAVLRRNIADSFVNLGRRNQNLLGRQLDFITELETNETDPDTLANLFRLDHLATRMRRNAESLLVLAGIEPPRKWAAPVRLTDVIRAALGEVEDYQRVTVRGVEPATIIGSAAADLAHLLAELIENALVFSPPDQTVDIRGRSRADGYTLAIIDSGLGMPPTDVTAANRRLAGAESFTIAPSKYLGHYVAGNLAARHNIHVNLDNSPGNGITATIDIPPTLLTDDTALPQADEPHGTRALAAASFGGEPALAAPGAPARPAQASGWITGSAAPVADETVPAAPFPPAPAEASRTQSGLVKRTSRQGNGSTVGAERPSGDLLDSLSRHTANLHGGPPPAGRAPAPEAPDRAPEPTAWAPQGPDHAPEPPAWAPQGPDHAPEPTAWAPQPEPHRAPEPPAWAPQPEPHRAPEPPAWGAAPQAPVRPASGRSWPVPPPIPPPPEPPTPTWSPTPAPSDWSPRPPVSRERLAPPAARPPLDLRGNTAETPAAGADGTTSGGLTRRVRGAQLPTTEPVRMRRSPEPTPAPAPARAPARTPEQRRRADDVYSFLSSFTAGVRRGLHESAPDGQGDGPPA